MAGHYSYLACDLITGRVRESIQLVNVTAERTLDQSNPGQFSALMPLTRSSSANHEHGLFPGTSTYPSGGAYPGDDAGDDEGSRVLRRSWIDATESARSTIVVVRDGVALGEWIIWDRPDRPNNAQPIPIEGAYITSYFDQVYPTFSVTAGDLPADGWSATEQLTIANAVAAQCADPITSSTAPAGSRGITLTIPSVTASGQLRDRNDWPAQYKSALAMLNDLAGVLNGFDWDIDVQLVGNQVVRSLTLSYPRRGIDSGVVIQPAEGKPGGNATHVAIGEDGTRIATQVIGVGGGSGGGQAIVRSPNPALVAAFPLLQKVYTDASVLDPVVLQATADSLAANTRSSQVPPKVTLLADKDPILGSYRCGDYVTLVLGQSTNYPDGYKVKVRILKYTINPPKAGPETVSLEVGLIPEV